MDTLPLGTRLLIWLGWAMVAAGGTIMVGTFVYMAITLLNSIGERR